MLELITFGKFCALLMNFAQKNTKTVNSRRKSAKIEIKNKARKLCRRFLWHHTNSADSVVTSTLSAVTTDEPLIEKRQASPGQQQRRLRKWCQIFAYFNWVHILTTAIMPKKSSNIIFLTWIR